MMLLAQLSGATQQIQPYSLGWLSVWIARATLVYLLIDVYYSTNPQILRDELSTVLSLAGRDAAAIARELQDIETRCRASGTDVTRGLAERLVLMNNDRASQLLR